MRLVTNQSDLSPDPDTAAWRFESAGDTDASAALNPLTILLQRELEIEEDFEYYLPRNTS